MACKIDGNFVSNDYKNIVKSDVNMLKSVHSITPNLVTILIGDNPASESYVKKKKDTCEELGMASKIYKLSEEIKQKELTDLIKELNENKNVNGILVQLPLPEHINQYEIMDIIDSLKDVDGFHKENVAKLYRGEDCLEPCTPKGILTLLHYYGIKMYGKKVTIIGRSDIVGRPLATMMSNRKINSTVTVCHSKTEDLENITKQADILICAIGKPNYVNINMVKEGTAVIDVGVNRINDHNAKKGYRLVGDVDYDEVKDKVAYITPVPGGVGPMTILSLMQNTLKATYYQHNIKFRY